MESRRWFNQSQPQTMQIAVFLLYASAVFALLLGSDSDDAISASLFKLGIEFRWLGDLVRGLFAAACALAGFGIANEKRSAYRLGVAAAIAPLAGRLFLMIPPDLNYPFRRPSLFDFDLISLMFDIAMLALLVHPQSRSYERIWFK